MHTSVLQSLQVRSVDALAREFKYQNLEVHTVVALQWLADLNAVSCDKEWIIPPRRLLNFSDVAECLILW